ncbi:gastric triacylglycerol lipase [Trichuris trichiura]|uniref:Gastric triacylglycerol lipase n=1 Tax=Trichuris trichiura TaxID=36087 RepID=A0A077ZR22_TRITR|nr:gastric triacylglycerol lipase [Trichuris trichiura]
MRGYACQEHSVVTKDGYILTMQRLASTRDAGMNKTVEPVILQHGLLQSSVDWVINYPNQSLGFLLADAGYDVWLGNIRGNTYSKSHVSLSSRSKEYWGFTFDQMAEYDLPAMVEYVLQVTNHSSLDYVGHSQGSLIGSFHAFAPVAFLGHTKTVLTLLRPFFWMINWMLENFGYEFMPKASIVRWLGGMLCVGRTAFLCENIILLIGGYDSENMNSTRLPVYLGHNPAGTSTLNIAHFGQLIITDRMQKYDYGFRGNLKHYKQWFPPEYQPQRNRVPTALYWGAKDILSDEADVKRLIKISQHELGLYRYEDTGHLDFMWGLNMAGSAYAQLIRVLSTLPAE